jgi:hypothetical protein
MAKARAVPILVAGVMLLAEPALAWTPDFDAAFNPFPHRGPRPEVASVAVAVPVARPVVPETRPTLASMRGSDPSEKLAAYCRRPGKSSLSWIRVSGRRYYCRD